MAGQSRPLSAPGNPPYGYAPDPRDDGYAPGAQGDRYDQAYREGPVYQDSRYGPGPQDGHQYSPGSQYGAGPQYGPGPQNTPHNPGVPAGWSAPGAAASARQFRIDLRRLSRVDQTVGGASLVVLISLFLPWFGFGSLDESFSVSGTTAHGYLVIVVILAVLLVGYLLLRSGWDELPVNLPIAHAPLLLIGTGLQLLLVVIGFIDVPVSGLSWEIGAYLAVIAAVVAAGPLIVPAVRSWQAGR